MDVVFDSITSDEAIRGLVNRITEFLTGKNLTFIDHTIWYVLGHTLVYSTNMYLESVTIEEKNGVRIDIFMRSNNIYTFPQVVLIRNKDSIRFKENALIIESGQPRHNASVIIAN